VARTRILSGLGAAALIAGACLAVAPGSPASRDRIEVVTGLRYAATPAAVLDVYRRRDRAGRALPAVLVVHGGGWRHGDKRRMVGVSRALAGAGFAAFNLNYTLASWARPGYRRQPAELRAAVEWIRRNAARMDVDPRRIGALGSSAGAHLAALLALGGRGPLDRGSRIRAAVTWSAPFDLSRPGGPGLPGAIDTFLGCALRPCDLRRAAASPVNHASPDDPPMLIVNSADELVPARHAVEMAARLRSAGVPHRLWILPGTRHARSYSDAALGPSIDFLRRRLN
jgi:acetyl esterase/lipase